MNSDECDICGLEYLNREKQGAGLFIIDGLIVCEYHFCGCKFLESINVLAAAIHLYSQGA